MPTLRDHVKETLAAQEPDEGTARADLEAIRQRIARRRRVWVFPVIAGPLLAAAVVLLVMRRTPLPVPTPEPAQETALGGVHLYLHVEGEPVDRALAIDLTVKGQPR